jgi:AbrB family looped-hinge helix DNA binding protein
MKVTSKGQVTIPIGIREKLGILANTEVEFVLEGKEAILRKVATGERGRKIVEALRGRGNVRMTTDEILALTREAR